MDKHKALELGYCKHCAAYGLRGWNCGVTIEPHLRTDSCILPPDVVERFKAERGLEGETKRHQKLTFGDRSSIPKRRARKKKYI